MTDVNNDCTYPCIEKAMKRTYKLKRRAVKQAETRLRIVEAAVDLHSTVGPARTSLTMVADRAGVQRHTLYAHFPDERSLMLACSALALERSPLPDPEPWRALAEGAKRLQVGLGEVYGWYDRNAELAACVLRDAEFHPLTQEIVALRLGPHLLGCLQVLGGGLAAEQRAILELALRFYTWRSLVRVSGLGHADAVDAMVRAIEGAEAKRQTRSKRGT